MSLAQWTGEVAKMSRSFGAPLTEAEVKAIGAYLAVAYGAAREDDPGVVEASAGANPAIPPESGAQATLAANGCLGCHAPDHTVVGPSFHDVALRYRDQADAKAKLAASIRAGGSGRWGEPMMPPFTTLSDAQAASLAAFVLTQ
jgi:cytochrome c551/c552